MTDETRAYYADKMSTVPQYVKAWDELNEAQRESAKRTFGFFGTGRLNDFVYCIATDGDRVVSRRKAAKGMM